MPLPKVCVSLYARTRAELLNAIEQARARQVAAIELRLDYLDAPELVPALRDVPQFATAARDRLLILTLRPQTQGGARQLELAERLACWSSLPELPQNCFVDWEFDLVAHALSSGSISPDWNRGIVSHHDFDAMPESLERIYEEMRRTPAKILKIAAPARDVTDCLPIFRLLERARSDRREIIAIAMGEAGAATRVLGPAFGSFLTYGALEQNLETAPGQLTAHELNATYHVDRLDRETAVMGLIGAPVRHSVSPQMHNAAFAACGLNAVYLPLCVTDVNSFLKRMAHPKSREFDWNLRGLSVTAPHKVSVMPVLDWIDAAALEIGAVNTIVVADGELRGYNTDAAALIAPLLSCFDTLREKRCAILGAGGAARTAAWALKKAGASVVVAARNETAGANLARQFGAECSPLSATNFAGFDLVLNATPLGTRGALENQTALGREQLRGARVVYDLVYNPLETLFLREAQAAGCETLNGLQMLVGQGAAQFELWMNTKAPVEAMREAARLALASPALESVSEGSKV